MTQAIFRQNVKTLPFPENNLSVEGAKQKISDGFQVARDALKSLYNHDNKAVRIAAVVVTVGLATVATVKVAMIALGRFCPKTYSDICYYSTIALDRVTCRKFNMQQGANALYEARKANIKERAELKARIRELPGEIRNAETAVTDAKKALGTKKAGGEAADASAEEGASDLANRTLAESREALVTARKDLAKLPSVRHVKVDKGTA